MSTQTVERSTSTRTYHDGTPVPQHRIDNAEPRDWREEYRRSKSGPYVPEGERIRRKLVREHRDRAKQFVGKLVEAEYKPNWPAYRRCYSTKWIRGRVEKVHVYDGNVRYKINGEFIPRDSLVTWIVDEESVHA